MAAVRVRPGAAASGCEMRPGWQQRQETLARAGGPVSEDDLATVQADFPGYRIWREILPGRDRYVVRSLVPGLSPHTLVTDDLGELRDAAGTGQPCRSRRRSLTAKANVARMYAHWLGGKDSFEADRAAADSVLVRFPRGRRGCSREPGVPGPCRAACRSAGRSPVHRLRSRAAGQPERARDRPRACPGCPCRLSRSRSGRVVPRASSAGDRREHRRRGW